MGVFKTIADNLRLNFTARLYGKVRKRIFSEHLNSVGKDIGKRKDGKPVNMYSFEKYFKILSEREIGFTNKDVERINGYLQKRFGTYVKPQPKEIRDTIKDVITFKR
jgi:hypothetical protein